MISKLGLFSDLIGKGFDLVKSYYPPDMTAEQQAQLDLKLAELKHDQLMKVQKLDIEHQQQFNDRIKSLEGTASDLKQLGFMGRIVLFARGCQRPVWGFFTMYLDYQWFFTANEYTEQQGSAMWAINILVLGFLFGERAIKNLQPVIEKVFKSS